MQFVLGKGRSVVSIFILCTLMLLLLSLGVSIFIRFSSHYVVRVDMFRSFSITMARLIRLSEGSFSLFEVSTSTAVTLRHLTTLVKPF